MELLEGPRTEVLVVYRSLFRNLNGTQAVLNQRERAINIYYILSAILAACCGCQNQWNIKIASPSGHSST